MDKEIVIDTIVELLEKGNSVELPASGNSMFPTLRHGDRIVVMPINKDALPVPGNVVVFIDNKSLVVHRLIAIYNVSGVRFVETRGDSSERNDNPKPFKDILGIAVNLRRGKKSKPIKNFVPSSWFYLYNRLVFLISIYFKRFVLV